MRADPDALLDHLGPRAIVLADKAYDADRIRKLIQDQSATLIPESNRRWKPRFSKRLYPERNLIERFLFKPNYFRRVATRYDRCPVVFFSAIEPATTITFWLRSMGPDP